MQASEGEMNLDGNSGCTQSETAKEVPAEQSAVTGSMPKDGTSAKLKEKKKTTPLTPEMTAARDSAVALMKKAHGDFEPIVRRLRRLADTSHDLREKVASTPQPEVIGRKIGQRRILQAKVDYAHNSIAMDARAVATIYLSEIIYWEQRYLDPNKERGATDAWSELAEQLRQAAIERELGPLAPYIHDLSTQLRKNVNTFLANLEATNLQARNANKRIVEKLPLAERESDSADDDESED